MTNFKNTLELLKQNDLIEVNYKLTRGQRAAVKRGFAIQKCYQDQPANIPYVFRPIKYFLKRSDNFYTLLNTKR